ncbi:MAG: carbon-nitrogen hydrolase family protein [Actinomycetota bacterium]|nr:carbon-nitrogen hydrolase family protein [Actinomycetota bacterium]
MKIKIAACQLKVEAEKQKNLNNARNMIRRAAKHADIIILPEMFNCPYSIEYFPQYAEQYPGPTTYMLSALARELKTFIVGGSIPEKEENHIYNTSFVFNPQGNLVARHRKIHLFDVNIPGKISFMESKILSAGSRITTFDTGFCTIGLCICYDMRFPELIRAMSHKQAKLIIVPAAFNMTTGPAHWHVVTRSRALDNQVYLAAVSPARNQESSYIAFGHSVIVDPWGKIIAEAGSGQQIIYASLDLDYLTKVREQLPLLKHLKPDIY